MIGKIKYLGQILGAEIIYIFAFFVFYLRFMLHYRVWRDDVYFSSEVEGYSLFEFLSMRYEQWSSRVFIEAGMWIYFKILKHSDIFVFVFFSLCFVGLFWSLCYLLKPKTIFQKLVILFFVVGFPRMYLMNAGWGVIILNYIMPLGFGIFALGAVRDVADCKSISRLKAICYVVASLVAGCMEQYAFIMGGVFVLALMWFYIQDKKIVFIFLAEFGALVCDAILFLCSQGNKLRYIKELQYLPELSEMSVIDKFSRGMTYVLDLFFWDEYVLCVLFLLVSLVAFAGWILQRKKIFLTVWGGMVIVTVIIVYYMMHHLIYSVGTRRLGVFYFLPVLLMLGGGFLLALLYQYNFKFWLVLMLVGGGGFSVVILGFAPSLFPSSIRVFIGFIFILIYLLLRFFVCYADKIPYCNWIMFAVGLYWAGRAMLDNVLL